MFTRRKFAIAAAGASALQAHDDQSANPALDRVGLIHGGTGPFAVAGYRMGEAALRELKLNRGSFDLEVIHYAPREVQWSCVVDGLQASTGASLGKLNLSLVESSKDKVFSVIRDRKTGREVKLELTPEFVKANLDLPMTKLAAAGAKLTVAPEKEIFRTIH